MFNSMKTNTISNQIYPSPVQFQQQQAAQHAPQNIYQMCQNFNTNVKNEYSPLMNIQQQQQHLRFQIYNQNPNSHSKSYSLPANFQDPNPQQYMIQNKIQPPPPRSLANGCGDIPLPSGWELEKTSTGQAYYINHLTKTTSWEDPRKLLNLPQNQIDISSDMRKIINSIPLPNGWEEAHTVNNEVYFINHQLKTTTWEDPRIAIYMQQQQQQQHLLQINECKFPFSSIDSSRILGNSSSTSSICSTASSSSSSSCSFSSSTTSLNDAKKFEMTKKEQIRKDLNDLLSHKNLILQQIDELHKQEMMIKSKLTGPEIDQVLQVLHSNISSSATTGTPSNNKINIFNNNNLIDSNDNYHQISNFDNNASINSDNNSDMDTTLVTDS